MNDLKDAPVEEVSKLIFNADTDADGAELLIIADHARSCDERRVVDRLARIEIDGGRLALLANINAAFKAVDHMPPEAELAERAGIRLALYSAASAEDALPLTPIRAIGLPPGCQGCRGD
jgi:hypothetical protein